jgi:hypothetical protein
MIVVIESCENCGCDLDDDRIEEPFGEFCQEKCRDMYVAELEEQLIAA